MIATIQKVCVHFNKKNRGIQNVLRSECKRIYGKIKVVKKYSKTRFCIYYLCALKLLDMKKALISTVNHDDYKIAFKKMMKRKEYYRRKQREKEAAEQEAGLYDEELEAEEDDDETELEEILEDDEDDNGCDEEDDQAAEEDVVLGQEISDEQWINNKTGSDSSSTNYMRFMITDDNLWEKLETMVELLRPIHQAIRDHERDIPMLSKVFFQFNQLRSFYENHDNECSDVIAKVVDDRWTYVHKPIHGALYVWDPDFYDKDYDELEDAVKRDCDVMIKKMALWATHKDMLAMDASHEYPKLPVRNRALLANQKLLKDSHTKFMNSIKGDLEGDEYVLAQEDYQTLPAHLWWQQYGPGLQYGNLFTNVMKRLNALNSSASSGERNWSSFGTVLTTKTNRLLSDRLFKKVYVYHNQNFLHKWEDLKFGINKQPTPFEPNMYWHIDADDVEMSNECI